MTALWWIGLLLATFGALHPREDRARLMAALGVALLVLNAVRVMVAPH